MIRVRLAEPRDVPGLPDIEIAAGLAFLGTAQAWCAAGEVMPAEDYYPLIEDDAVWVVEDDGVLAGFVTTEIEDDFLHVWELAVHQDHQRKGAGRALLAAVGEAAREAGCGYLALTTFTNLVFNAPYYQSLGWRIDDAPGPWIADILANEVDEGFTDRCAMRFDL
jgi:GNAT superfamily N-acetyltransferase